MAVFPSNVGFQVSGYGRKRASVIERSEVERGPAKVRRTATDVVTTVTATLIFRTAGIEMAFSAWFMSTAGASAGAAWFDFLDPRTKRVVQARIVSLDDLSPLTPSFGFSQQACVLEYVETAGQIAADAPRRWDFAAGLAGWAYYDLGNGAQGTATPYSGSEGSGLLLTRPAASAVEIGVRMTQWNTGTYAIPVTPGQQRRIKFNTTRKTGVDGGNVGLYGNFVNAAGGYYSGHFAPTPAVSPVTPGAFNVIWVVPADIVGVNLEIYWGNGSDNGSVAVTNIEVTAA